MRLTVMAGTAGPEGPSVLLLVPSCVFRMKSIRMLTSKEWGRMYWVPGSWEEWLGAWTPESKGGGAWGLDPWVWRRRGQGPGPLGLGEKGPGTWTPGSGGGGAAVGPPDPKEGGLGSHPGLEQPLPLCHRLLQKPLHAGDVWVEGPTARRREQRSGHGTVGRPLSCISPPSP